MLKNQYKYKSEKKMRKFVYKYKASKYKRFLNGLLFAFVSITALYLCITYLRDNRSTSLESLLPFCIAVISLFLGFFSMFKPQRVH